MTIAIPRMTRVPPAQRGITIADYLVPIRVGDRVSPLVRNVAFVLAGALLIYLTARVAIPIPGNPVPITLQNFGVLLVGGALGMRRGGLAAFLYLAFGVIGLPFFAEGKGGIQVIWGTTGGYLVGFVLAGAIVGWLAEHGWDRRLGGAIGATLIGTLAIYALGVPWLAAVTGKGPAWAIENGLLPFVLVDTAKLLAAAVVFPAAWWVVGRRPSEP